MNDILDLSWLDPINKLNNKQVNYCKTVVTTNLLNVTTVTTHKSQSQFMSSKGNVLPVPVPAYSVVQSQRL